MSISDDRQTMTHESPSWATCHLPQERGRHRSVPWQWKMAGFMVYSDMVETFLRKAMSSHVSGWAPTVCHSSEMHMVDCSGGELMGSGIVVSLVFPHIWYTISKSLL